MSSTTTSSARRAMPRRATPPRRRRWTRRSAWAAARRAATATNRPSRGTTSPGKATTAKNRSQTTGLLLSGLLPVLHPRQGILAIEELELLVHPGIRGSEQLGRFEERFRAHGEEFRGALGGVGIDGQRVQRSLHAPLRQAFGRVHPLAEILV